MSSLNSLPLFGYDWTKLKPYWENQSVSKKEATAPESASWKTDLKIPARMQGGPYFHRNPKAKADS